ncbi:hypothetical protein LshimejAT787_0402650 [Lyophyllum shimeji]|uniref:THO1-MOS11 C-terminal domain-containing protein n=1 Tax=Lyophyllum shimeji TaxID=47721 RepID=A0A9P3PKP9_LYOSH|nr:hypothetical protein LshimejAT787_0402650 [Lyophyllum shimeji]
MDNQLKTLKVADLRAILAKAHVQVSSKTNKNDLVAKILASQPALDAYKSMYKSDDLLAPPEDDDWNNDQEPRVPSSEPLPAAPPPEPPKPPTPEKQDTKVENGTSDASGTTTQGTEDAPDATGATINDEDLEAEKRRKRAERFGIPLVEPPQPRPQRTQVQVPQKLSSLDDPKKLEARASRFGTNSAAQKRSAPTEVVDAEEQEKRRKRAERFGLSTAGPKA